MARWMEGAKIGLLTGIALSLVACIGPFKKDKSDDDDGDDDDSQQVVSGWTEADWCGDMADLSDLEADFDPSDLRGTLIALSERRYPPGVGFIDAQTDGNLINWTNGATSFSGVLDSYGVVVHEGAHIWGFEYFVAGGYGYRVVDDDYEVFTDRLDNFDRSAILDRHPDAAGDFYADLYLTGSMGAQGFNTLLDEYNAYTHSLASEYCTRDALGDGSATSARDGILTFMFYVETYLKIAREEHPDDYADILADPGHIDVILSVWDRAEYWLDITANDPSMGIDDDEIALLTYDPDNLAEINRLR